ncbi:MAG: hypothetical protein LBM28_07610, partial [Oscillospiraceae bacterium]|nr:hypothetical protein [Oscillospiraceae bacterium]
AAIYPDGFGSVLDESEKAFIVHDNSENCVVILNVTEEYLSYSQLDNDFLYECIGYYVSEYFNYIYGDGSESGMGDVTYGQGGPDRRLATATVNLFNETNDMDVYVILESLTNEDGSDGYYVAAYFSQYGETDQADSIRQVSYYGLNN